MHVLIVDDKPDNLYLLQALLEGNGFSVSCANEGGQALESARAFLPDIVVSDILMPGMDGFALCREWKKDPDLQRIPFVFYTATYTDSRDEKLALDLGADRYLVKPMEPDLFMQQIRSVLTEFSHGKIAPRSAETDEIVMREYNQALVRKLENKLTELEYTVKRLNESESKLEEANRVLGAIFDAAGDGILMADAESRRFLKANKAICDMLDYSAEELLSLAVADIHPTEDLPRIFTIFERLLSDKIVLAPDISVLRKDRSAFPADIHASRIELDGRSFLLGIFRDISDHKKAEEKIQNLLQEKDLLLREVHHRIKNNMSSMNGLLRLQAHAQKDPAIAKALQDAATRVQSMVVLYDKLYRSESLRDISLRVYLPALIEELTRDFPTDAAVSVETAIEDVVLAANLVFPLGILMTELITNSMKHAFKDRSNGTIRISAFKRGKELVILFEDDGIGLPKDVTLESSPGFGLQLVRMLVRQVKGTVSVESRAGTRYHIEFAV